MHYILRTDTPKIGISDTRLKKLIKDQHIQVATINDIEVIAIPELLRHHGIILHTEEMLGTNSTAVKESVKKVTEKKANAVFIKTKRFLSLNNVTKSLWDFKTTTMYPSVTGKLIQLQAFVAEFKSANTGHTTIDKVVLVLQGDNGHLDILIMLGFLPCMRALLENIIRLGASDQITIAISEHEVSVSNNEETRKEKVYQDVTCKTESITALAARVNTMLKENNDYMAAFDVTRDKTYIKRIEIG
jgi:hypothetical protein